MYDYEKINIPLLKWYEKHGRKLPWRETAEPYHIWVSEIMLQQTRVEAVKAYYERFLAALPDIKSLAVASEDKLLKLWEGLGYYSRVKNMKKAAVTVVENYDSQLPPSYTKLQELSGIGSYTAGAIASIAFHIPIAAVDGNLMRVAVRLAADRTDISRASTKKDLERTLTMSMDKKHPGEWNQAMMDLGATVCIPNGAPKCGDCPLERLCLSSRGGLTDIIPVKSKRSVQVREKKTVFIFRCGDSFAIRKRPSSGLLAGLWEFPVFNGHYTVSEMRKLLAFYGADYEMRLLGREKHVFSQIIWDMLAYEIILEEVPEAFAFQILPREDNKIDLTGLLWKRREEIEAEYGIASALTKYKRMVFSEV